MKNLLLLLVFTFCAPSIFSLVGNNKTDSSTDLYINGTFQVLKFTSSSNMNAKKILGIDDEGNLVEVEVDENIILKNNKLRVVENGFHAVFSDGITDGTIHDHHLLILPGEPNDNKKIIKIRTSRGSIDVKNQSRGGWTNVLVNGLSL